MTTTVRIPLGDHRLHLIGALLTNKTAVRLVEVLAEHSLSVSELAENTGIPLSTVDYTLKKLHAAGLVVETGRWWSSKGKAVPRYTVADKDITISPRPVLRGILPAVLGSGLIAAFVKWSGIGMPAFSEGSEDVGMEVASSIALERAFAEEATRIQPGAGLVLPDIALWFLFGSFVGIALLATWHLFFSRMKGGSIS